MVEASTTTAKENPSNYTSYGWVCPKCGAVMSPWASYCINCHGNTFMQPYCAWHGIIPPAYGPTVVTKDKVEITC